MLTQDQILMNKQEFVGLVGSIKREGANIDRLLNKLENSDFYYAPASTKYHLACEGGLCLHSLNVYHNLLKLVQTIPGLDPYCYDEDSLKIVALFHDISKMNIYEKTVKNVKQYREDGDKWDEMGRFKWVAELSFKTKDKKFVYGSHEMTAEYIIRQFVPLNIDESVAILHHMGTLGWDSAQDNIAEIYSQYQLALLLHTADMMSTYITEKPDNE
jgi:hypothetical protein